VVADGAVEITHLREDLLTCQQELAALRLEQETWAEEMARLQHSHDHFLEASRRLDEWLISLETESADGLRARLKRRFITRMPTAREAEQIARLRATPLFDGAWYLREYPQVIGTGMSAALHYLRRGARNGRNPGPDFDTAAYVRRTPTLPAKANPLLHYLESLAAGQTPVARR
jgi:hypothetical protein